MDLFPDGQCVWLRSRGRGEMYLHADEDGVGVRLSSKRASLLSAWQVHRVVAPGGQNYVHLYGRYLTMSRNPAPHGRRLVIQGPYNENFNAVAWRPERVGAGDVDDKVLLQHSSDDVLRANGHFFQNKGVSADVATLHNRTTPMSHWVVRAIPPRPFPPQLPAAVPDAHGGCFCMCGKKYTGSVFPGVAGRVIRFVRAADDGTFPPNVWSELRFYGRSVADLRAAVAGALQESNVVGIKLCVRAGNSARLTPLTVDLPRGEKRMDIVVLTEGSPAAVALQYPDIDVQ